MHDLGLNFNNWMIFFIKCSHHHPHHVSQMLRYISSTFTDNAVNLFPQFIHLAHPDLERMSFSPLQTIFDRPFFRIWHISIPSPFQFLSLALIFFFFWLSMCQLSKCFFSSFDDIEKVKEGWGFEIRVLCVLG